MKFHKYFNNHSDYKKYKNVINSVFPETKYFNKVFYFLNLLHWIRLLKYGLSIRTNSEITHSNRRLGENNKLHFVYFSCKQHFDYLYASLKSLEKIKIKEIGNIYLYIDKNDFLKKSDFDKLKKINLNLIVAKTKYTMSWSGLNFILNELYAFKEIYNKMGNRDFLAKADSDILFISAKAFQYVLISKYDFIGRRNKFYNIGCDYVQGGCFFLNKRIISKITKGKILPSLRDISGETEFPLFKTPEDITMFNIVRRSTNKIRFLDFFLFAGEDDEVGGLNKPYCSLIHFEACNKKLMLEVMNNINDLPLIKKIIDKKYKLNIYKVESCK